MGGAKGHSQQFYVSSLNTLHPSEDWSNPKTKSFEQLPFDYFTSIIQFFFATSVFAKLVCLSLTGIGFYMFLSQKSKATTSRALNYFMRKLYASGLFIEGDLCGYMIDACGHFLKGYSWLAYTCHGMGLARFPAMPKSHMLFHVRQFMKEQTNAVGYCENPIAASCACDEDMIGKVCYLTRCVSPKNRIKRCLER